jgi:dTDP-4-dehydrorhamnose reductase
MIQSLLMTLENLSKTTMIPNNILILGKGYMGNHVYNHLLKNEHSVQIVSSKELNYHESDLLYKYILNKNITTVINCSGFTGRPNIDEAEIKKELCWNLNVVIPLKINKICDLLNVDYIHISSGCIYDGYEKEWNEEDKSNYGLFDNNSSFYSKSKHAFEILSNDLKGVILRIRMPFGPDDSSRNYLNKIRSYDKLINFKNSKTYIPDFCEFVNKLIHKRKENYNPNKEIYNVVNPSPLYTNEVCDIMKDYGFHNGNWNFVSLSSLEIATGRSNCTLNCDKVQEIHNFKTERESLNECYQIKMEKIEQNNSYFKLV